MTSITSNATEIRALRKWVLVALVLSLALHGALFWYFHTKELERFSFTTPDAARLVPRAFTVKKVTISDDLFKPSETPAPPKPTPIPTTVLPPDKPTADVIPDVRFAPSATPTEDLAKTFTVEKPKVEASNLPQPTTNAQVDTALDSIKEQIGGPANAPKIVASDHSLPTSTNTGAPDSRAIDALLTQSGPLTGNVAPVPISDQQGGALFEYGSADLHPAAIETIRKLGILIERNPRSTFRIEGYTDSFGTVEYNLKLSQARADAVKTWLIENMKLDPEKIQTQGYGSARPVVPITGTREEQAPNRRVEIVIRTPKD